MLVLDPAKRYSVEQIKNHKWMHMEGGAPPMPTNTTTTSSTNVSGITSQEVEYNEQALRLMQSLGIDQQRTMEVSW